MLLLEEPAPDGYLEDGLINWGAHVLVQCALNLPMWLLQLPFNPLYLADAWWWTPVNAINLWDDARKNQKVHARLEREWLNNLVATTPSKTSMLINLNNAFAGENAFQALAEFRSQHGVRLFN